MGSINVAVVAKKMSDKISSGKLINKRDVMRESGYSEQSAISQRAFRTKTYKKLAIPLVEGLQEQITKFKQAIAEKDLSKEELRVLMYSLDTAVKNYQLLSGGATERQVFVMPAEILERNNLAITNDKLKELPNGSS